LDSPAPSLARRVAAGALRRWLAPLRSLASQAPGASRALNTNSRVSRPGSFGQA